mmetsp:Transcript_45466/g.104960  ORF Transcript_45466/g.104960 Transcript_45466/m.104960 type:complete len:280 (-) Transcript_45466:753-1592(-)
MGAAAGNLMHSVATGGLSTCTGVVRERWEYASDHPDSTAPRISPEAAQPPTVPPPAAIVAETDLSRAAESPSNARTLAIHADEAASTYPRIARSVAASLGLSSAGKVSAPSPPPPRVPPNPPGPPSERLWGAPPSSAAPQADRARSNPFRETGGRSARKSARGDARASGSTPVAFVVTFVTAEEAAFGNSGGLTRFSASDTLGGCDLPVVAPAAAATGCAWPAVFWLEIGVGFWAGFGLGERRRGERAGSRRQRDSASLRSTTRAARSERADALTQPDG